MSVKSLEVTTFEFPEQEPQLDVVDEQSLSFSGLTEAVSHIDRHDRNDPLGYYGSLLDETKGDVRAASRILMDSMINHKLF